MTGSTTSSAVTARAVCGGRSGGAGGTTPPARHREGAAPLTGKPIDPSAGHELVGVVSILVGLGPGRTRVRCCRTVGPALPRIERRTKPTPPRRRRRELRRTPGLRRERRSSSRNPSTSQRRRVPSTTASTMARSRQSRRTATRRAPSLLWLCDPSGWRAGETVEDTGRSPRVRYAAGRAVRGDAEHGRASCGSRTSPAAAWGRPHVAPVSTVGARSRQAPPSS